MRHGAWHVCRCPSFGIKGIPFHSSFIAMMWNTA